MKKITRAIILWVLCILQAASGISAWAETLGDPVHEASGIPPFGMPKEKLGEWLDANMLGGYTYREGWKTEDYERIEVDGEFLYEGRLCKDLIVEVNSAEKLTNLDFRIVDALYPPEEHFNMDRLMQAYDAYIEVVKELTAAYGAPDGGVLRYGADEDEAVEDRPYPEDVEALRVLVQEDVPFLSVLRFGNVLLTCYKGDRRAGQKDSCLGTSMFFFGPSKLEFAKTLFELYPVSSAWRSMYGN